MEMAADKQAPEPNPATGGSDMTDQERERVIRETREAGMRAEGGGSSEDIEASETDGTETGS
jgi:hypothetical protein